MSCSTPPTIPVVLVVEDNARQSGPGTPPTRPARGSRRGGGNRRGSDRTRHRPRQFDVILMDHQLPGMNGRDATRELRRRNVTTAIVGLTASATAADEQACLDAGMNAFLAKPVGLDRLSRDARRTDRHGTIETDTSTDPDRTDRRPPAERHRRRHAGDARRRTRQSRHRHRRSSRRSSASSNAGRVAIAGDDPE